MKIFYFLLISASVVLSSCSAKANEEEPETEVVAEDIDLPKNLKIANPSLYGKEFIQDLKNYEGTIRIDGAEMFIGDDTEATLIPTFLEKGKSYTFKGERNGSKLVLTVKAINLTDISYEINQTGNNPLKKSGIAKLPGMFFLGAESFEVDGLSIFASEYRDYNESTKEYFSINISDEYITDGKLVSVITYQTPSTEVEHDSAIVLTSDY